MRFVSLVRFAASAAGMAGLLAAAPQALAQDDDDDQVLEEIIVEGSLRSLPTQDVGSVFGFDKTLLETPRSASTISSDQIARFDIGDIDELIALAPGTFTQSFFGVAGSLDVRGTPGETYFRGVRRLDNPGNYPTPIGASDRIDIVRGPASPIYGPAKIGGYLNFVPKSARAANGAYLDAPEGGMSFTTGSWDKAVVTAEIGGPGSVGGRDFGYYVYGMVEDSGSYYDNSSTEQTLIQASFDVDVSDKLNVQFGVMYHDYDGNQIAGWNRLTQALVDNGTYLTGNAQPLDTDGDGSISHQEYAAASDFDYEDGDGAFFAPFVFRPEFVTAADLDSLAALVNVGTATLKGNQVLVAADDRLSNQVKTLYFDVIYTTDSDWEFKNQLFYESYNNLNENAYGFSQFHDSWVVEDKIVVSKVVESGGLTASYQFSPSIRYTDFRHADDYTNEYFDRRDLTGPSTALDRRLLATRIDKDYTEYDDGDYTDLGVAFLADFTWESGLSFLAGARYDSIELEGRIPVDKLLLGNYTSGFVILSDDGKYLLNDFVDPANYTQDDISSPVHAKDTVGGASWTASLSYNTPMGIIPYVTASEQSTLIAGQGANVTNTNIWSNGAYDTSELREVGIKGSFLDDRLYMALDYYKQERTDFSVQSIVTNTVNRTKGVEFETRWVPTDNLVLTFGYSNMEVVNLSTLHDGGVFSFYGAEDLRNRHSLDDGSPILPDIDPAAFYGAQVIGVPSTVPHNPKALRAGVPENIFTLTGTYAFDNGWALNASIIDVDSVYSSFSQVVRLPAYTLVNLGVVYETDNWTFSITGKNITDERYFRSNFPNLFGAQIVLPELPRNMTASVHYRF